MKNDSTEKFHLSHLRNALLTLLIACAAALPNWASASQPRGILDATAKPAAPAVMDLYFGYFYLPVTWKQTSATPLFETSNSEPIPFQMAGRQFAGFSNITISDFPITYPNPAVPDAWQVDLSFNNLAEFHDRIPLSGLIPFSVDTPNGTLSDSVVIADPRVVPPSIPYFINYNEIQAINAVAGPFTFRWTEATASQDPNVETYYTFMVIDLGSGQQVYFRQLTIDETSAEINLFPSKSYSATLQLLYGLNNEVGPFWNLGQNIGDWHSEVDFTTLGPFQLVSAASRKTHGGTVFFDVPLPITGNPGIEPRDGNGNLTLIFTFPDKIVSGNALISSGLGTIIGPPQFSRKTMTVNLTGVADVQTLGVTLSGVTSKAGLVAADAVVLVNMLIGDTTGDNVVDQGDLKRTGRQAGRPVRRGNFRSDVVSDGVIDASDLSAIDSHLGNHLP